MLIDFLIQNHLPPVEIKETEGYYQLMMEIPGSARDDIKVWNESGMLMITGEKKIPAGNKLLAGSIAGQFSRSFRIPDNAAIDKIEASYRDGVLTVAIPKIEQAKPKTIEVK